MPKQPKLNLLDLIDGLPDDSPKKERARDLYELYVIKSIVAETLNTTGSGSVALVPSGIIDLFAVGVVKKNHPDLIRRAIGTDGVADIELGRVDRKARKRGLTERNRISHEAADKLTEKIQKAERVYLESIPKHEIVSRLAMKFGKHPSTIRRHLKKTLTR